jgi:monothiol glutaredoxin
MRSRCKPPCRNSCARHLHINRNEIGQIMSEPVSERIGKIIGENDVVLFMKGVPAAPQCGFSATVVQILTQVGVPFRGVDVLSDQQIRDGIKSFSDWPTIPQLYVKGEFVGGCDIVREMYQAGELTSLLTEKGIACAAQ